MKTSDFDYNLPPELIAQTPIEPRDHSRLLVVNRADSSLTHRKFYEITGYLRSGDVMVFNNSRVIRARLFGTRLENGKPVEILLLRRLSTAGDWEALLHSKKRVEVGMKVRIEGNPDLTRVGDSAASLKEKLAGPGNDENRCLAEVRELRESSIRVVHFSDESILPRVGHVPLPPYIHEPLADPERYQTVYADREGSVAAPTAGLHFTPALLEKIRAIGVQCLFVTLHVGLNTFRPVRTEDILQHPIFPEYGVVDESTARAINLAKAEGRRVICVGTTSVRLVESAARTSMDKSSLRAPAFSRPLFLASPVHPKQSREHKPGSVANLDTGLPQIVKPFSGWANEFIYPGYQFRVMDALVTNFHLPKSTLLMLVSALAGKELVFKAYHEAIEQRYRFYSFGDAMLVL
jgi:S-adenosylmethionine:tRNA ribosyltransferase-isomerase